jgi:hypothetical protein
MREISRHHTMAGQLVAHLPREECIGGLLRRQVRADHAHAHQ